MLKLSFLERFWTTQDILLSTNSDSETFKYLRDFSYSNCLRVTYVLPKSLYSTGTNPLQDIWIKLYVQSMKI